MEDFAINARPVAAWELELRGSERVQFNGPLLRACISEAVSCASVSGCLEPRNTRLTDQCAKTFEAHNASVSCAEEGFGLRVKPADAIRILPTEMQDQIRGEWLPGVE